MLLCKHRQVFSFCTVILRAFRPVQNMARVYSSKEECIKDYKPLFSKDLLKGKVAVVTGGGTSIGFTITELFMRHGCDTAIISRNLEKLKSSSEILERSTGRSCLAHSADVRKPDELSKAFDAVLDKFKRIDIVVNNAAGNFVCPFPSMSFNAFKTVLEIDTVGCFNVSKTAFDKYLKDHGGVILNISATLHYNGQVFQTHAGSAKAAIDAMTKHLAAELGQFNIRVVGIAPGPIKDTVGFSKLGGDVLHDLLKDNIPLMRLGTKQELGQAALFLASDASSFVTGHTLVVDGGAWLSPMNSMKQNLKLFETMSKL